MSYDVTSKTPVPSTSINEFKEVEEKQKEDKTSLIGKTITTDETGEKKKIGTGEKKKIKHKVHKSIKESKVLSESPTSQKTTDMLNIIKPEITDKKEAILEKPKMKFNIEVETIELKDIRAIGEISKYLNNIRKRTLLETEYQLDRKWNEISAELTLLSEKGISTVLKNEFNIKTGEFLILANKLKKIDKEIANISNQIDTISDKLDHEKHLKKEEKHQVKELLKQVDKNLIEKSALLQTLKEKKTLNKNIETPKPPKPTKIKIKKESDIENIRNQIDEKKTSYSQIENKMTRMGKEIGATTEMLGIAHFYENNDNKEYIKEARKKIKQLDGEVTSFLQSKIHDLKLHKIPDDKITKRLKSDKSKEMEKCFEKYCEAQQLKRETKLKEISSQIQSQHDFLKKHMKAEEYETSFAKEFKDFESHPAETLQSMVEMDIKLTTPSNEESKKAFDAVIDACLNSINYIEERRSQLH